MNEQLEEYKLGQQQVCFSSGHVIRSLPHSYFSRRQAAHTEVQLKWHAASWQTKLKKILLGEVKERRVKLFRIVAPFLLGFSLLFVVGFVGQLLLRWFLVYYQPIKNNLVL